MRISIPLAAGRRGFSQGVGSAHGCIVRQQRPDNAPPISRGCTPTVAGGDAHRLGGITG